MDDDASVDLETYSLIVSGIKVTRGKIFAPLTEATLHLLMASDSEG